MGRGRLSKQNDMANCARESRRRSLVGAWLRTAAWKYRERCTHVCNHAQNQNGNVMAPHKVLREEWMPLLALRLSKEANACVLCAQRCLLLLLPRTMSTKSALS